VKRTPKSARTALTVVLLSAVLCGGGIGANAKSGRGGPELPEIRISTSSGVPQCVTPDRLLRYLTDRNPKLDARYRGIADLYKQHGDKLGIRWDYAFFQMLLETNNLTFTGDVRAKQNNFAGIGATGGGVRGESFADVSTGVLAQLQHLLAYAGERVEAPVAARTRENQSDIIDASRALRRPVRFSDLTNRWAADGSYARSMDILATRFNEAYCKASDEPQQEASGSSWQGEVKQTATPDTGPAKGGAQAAGGLACDIWSASYGGTEALLIRSVAGAKINYTVLQVVTGQEQPQADAYIKQHAHNGETIGRFGSRDEAMTRAFELCPRPS
jgi:hypothetical protein